MIFFRSTRRALLRTLAVLPLILIVLSVAFSQLAAAEPTRIISLGDSITRGVRTGVTAEETFSYLLEKALREKKFDVVVENVGIGGERTDQALVRLDKDVLSKKPAIVLIMYGANDSYIDQGKKTVRLSPEDYRKNLVKLVHRVRAAGAKPVLMTSNSYAKNPSLNGAGENPNDRLGMYIGLCREVAQEEKVPLVDHFAYWVEAEKNGTVLESWTTDKLHLNPAGHLEMTKLILPTVEKLLQE